MTEKNWDKLQRTHSLFEEYSRFSYKIPKPKLNDIEEEMDDNKVLENVQSALKNAKSHALEHLRNVNNLALKPNELNITSSMQGGMISVEVTVGPLPLNLHERVNNAVERSLQEYLKNQDKIEGEMKNTSLKKAKRPTTEDLKKLAQQSSQQMLKQDQLQQQQRQSEELKRSSSLPRPTPFKDPKKI